VGSTSVKNFIEIYASDNLLGISGSKDTHRIEYRSFIKNPKIRGHLELKGTWDLDSRFSILNDYFLKATYVCPIKGHFYSLVQYTGQDIGKWQKTMRLGIGVQF